MEMQSWPALVKHARIAPCAARSRSASSRTIIGFFPPSSSEQPMNRFAASSAILRPVRVEPVNAT